MNHGRCRNLPRTSRLLAALGFSGLIVSCALSAAAQGTAETAPRPTAAPGASPDAKPATPPRVGGDVGPDFRPSKPDVYYLRDKEGKLVPVPDFTYEDFKRLYDLDRKLIDAAAPPRYVLSSVSIVGKVENDQARLQIQVRVTTKAEGWVSIPLRLSGAVLRDQPKYDGAGKVLVEYHRERDGYVVWLQESDAKPHLLSLDTVVPIRKNGGTRRLAFAAPNAAVSDLRLTVPGKRIAATVSEGAGLLGVAPTGADASEIQVAGVGGDFQLTWLDAPAESAGVPATVEATSAIMVRIEGPRRLTSEARLKVRSYGIPLTTFRVKLPAGLEWFPLNEAGYRVNLVETLREPDKPPVSVVEVTLENKLGFLAEVRLRAVTPAREAVTEERLESLGFDVVGAVRQFGQVDFVVDGDWAVTWPERQNVQQVEVPDALRQQRVVARFEYFRQPCSLTVLVQPRKTRINVEPEYTVHVGPQALRLVAVLRYRVRGPNADRVQLDLAGWKLDQLQPEALVDRDLVREGAGGLLTLPLASDPATALQEFELRLEASRVVTAATEVLTVPLPRPQADTLSPARLIVIPADNVSLSPRLRDMPGGVAQLAPMSGTAGGPPPANNALAFELRADVEQPRFVADFKLRARQLTAGLDHQLRVEPRRIVVEQRFACQVAYEPLAQLRLAVPEDVSRDGFQAFLERGSGELDALTPNPESPADISPTRGHVLHAFDLNPERLGEFTVVIRYTVPWMPAGDEALMTTLRVPLIMPAEEASTRLSANAVRIAREPAWQVDVPDVGWVPDLRTDERGGESREVVRTAAGWADAVTLEITPVRSLENLGTVVRQAWVQSWFGRQWRQDRVVLRVQSSDRRLLLTLPRDVEREDLLVAVNGRRVNPSVSTEGTVRVDWEPTDSQAERTVELAYLAPRGAPRSGLLSVTLPQVVGARGEQRWLWQLVLPPEEHLVMAPAGWVAQRRWLWQAGFIDRRMNGTQGDLERALQASAQVEPPADANQYLFSNFAPDAVVEVRVVDRTVLVLVASGIVLLTGLMLLYFPRLRHPAMLWVLGVAGVGIAAITPALAALALQAGTLGIALSLCALMLRRLVRRRQTQRTVVRGSAVGVLEQPLSDFRKSRSESGLHATSTATLPPTLGSLLLLGAGAWFGGEARGQTPLPPPASAVRMDRGIGFRRVLVREEQIPELARGHLPLARVEFERLLEAAQRQLPEGAPATRIEQADYVTRWESSTLITGEAVLRVRHAGGSPAVLPLDPCDLPIHEARWTSVRPPSMDAAASDAPGAVDSRGAARIGATTTGGPCVIVEREGDLEWRFTVRGDGDPKNGGKFRARLPRSPRHRWWLELPDPYVPQIADAVVVGPGAETLLADVPAAVRPTPGRVWWCFELGGRTEVDWSVRSPAAGEPWSPRFSWRQESQYDVSLNGTEVRSTFRLDVSTELLTSLTFQIPASLHIGSMRLGDTALAWATRPSQTAEQREVQVDLPELQGSDRVLSITALSSTPLGTTWTLPRIECRGGFWQESNASVTVAEPLQIQSWQIRGGRQTRVGSLAAPAAAVSLGVQFHDADGRIEMALAVPAAQIRTLVGTNVSIDAAALTARAEATIALVRGRPFRISADVPQAWIVDGIEYSPEALVEDYSWEPSPLKDRQRLTLHLRNPLPRDRDLRLGIRAHRPRPADHEALLADSLRVLDFVADEELTAEGRYLVAVRADPAAPLQFRGDGDVTWLQAGQLAGPEAELVDAGADYLFVDGRDAAGLKGISERTRDAYSADLEVVARTLRDRVQERYRISCEPRGAPVSRLVAIFSQARAAPLAWQIAEDADALFTARRLSERELAAVTRAAGEGWEVLLRTPQSRPFTLRSERVSPWNDKLPLSLISLPESETQRGVVRVESVGETVSVSQTGLEGVPASATELLDAGAWVAGYRYDPARSPLVTVESGPATEGDLSAWAWSAELVTYHLEQGMRCHELTYGIENRGARQVVLRLPADAEGLALSVNGVSRASLVERRDGEMAVTIPLPAGERRVVARVTFRTRHDRLRGIAVLKPIQPALDVPVMVQTWVACVPAAYRPWEGISVPHLRGTNETLQFLLETMGRRLVSLVAPFSDDELFARNAADSRARGELRDDRIDPTLVWHRHEQIASPGADLTLQVVDGELVNGASWALLLLVAGCLAWPHTGWPRWLPLLLSALVAALPWIPIGWDPAPSGVFFGMLLGAAIGVLRRSRAPETMRAAHEGSTRRLATVASVTAAALLASVGLAVGFSNAVAQEPATVTRDDFQVLYPVDEEGRSIGEYVYVPQAFYQELRRRVRGAGGPLPGWIWRAANYRVLVRDVNSVNGVNGQQSAGWEVPSVTAQWEIDALTPDQRVTLPGNPVWGSLLSQRIQREGQDVDSSLELGPEGWSVVLGPPGRYQIQIGWRPSVRPRPAQGLAGGAGSLPLGDRWGFSQGIPRIPESRVTIEFPDGQRWLELPNVRGAVNRDGPGREWRAELGPVDQLIVEGVGGAADANPAMPVSVDQLVWFHLRPGSVTLETQWTFATTEGKLPRLARLAVDPRLRLLPLTPDQPIARHSNPEGATPWIQWEWAETVGDKARIRLSFLVAGSSGIGQWKLPRLQPWNAHVERRLLAVSTVSSLDTQRSNPTALQPIPVPEFLEAWGEAASTPQMAFRLSAGDSPWSLVTRLRDARVLATQTTELSLDLHSANVLWAADIEVAEGVVWQHSLAIPETLQVRDIALVDRAREENRILFWSRPAANRLQILLNAPLDGSHRLMVSGELPVTASGEWRFPAISLEGVLPTTQKGVLYRQPTTLVEWEDPAPVGLTQLAESEFRPGWGRRVAEWHSSAPEPWPVNGPLVLRVRENRVKTKLRIGTMLLPSEDGFVSEVLGRVAVEAGELDALRLEMPADWPTQLSLEPPIPYQWRSVPDRTRKILVLRPNVPWTKAFDFRLRGPSAAKDRFDIPDVRVLDWDDVEYYLWLPRHDLTRQVAWETSGLQATRWPDGLPQSGLTETAEGVAPIPPDSDEGTAYRVVGTRFRVSLRDLEGRGGAPRVRLADHQVFLDAQATGGGVSVLDVEAAGQAACVVALPNACDLVSLSLDGKSVRRQALGPRQWRVELAGASWPQRLEVVFAARAESADDRHPVRTLPCASVLDWPLQRFLATLTVVGEVDAGGGPIPAGEDDWVLQDLERLAAASEGAETAAESLISHPPQDAVDWWPAWQARFSVLEERLFRQRSPSTSWTPMAASEGDPWRRRFQQAKGRLRIADAGLPRDAASSSAERSAWEDRLVDLGTEPGDSLQRVRWSSRQDPGPIVLSWQPAGAGMERTRWLWSLMGGVAGLVWLGLSAGGRASQAWARWPQVALVLVGLGWWVAGPWPFMGLAVVAVGVLAAWRGEWGLRVVTL